MMRLSIVIPCFNLGAWLEPCLTSLAQQSCGATDWEIVLVDDGSTDDTGKRADAWARRLQNLRVVHVQNQGVSAARELGFRLSQGDYVWFVDGDDILAPCAVEWVGRHMEDDTPLIWVDEIFGSTIEFGQLSYRFESLGPDYSSVTRLVMHQCIFKRNLVEQVPFERFLVGEDILFTQKALVRASRAVHLMCPLYGYVKRGESVMNQRRNFLRTSQTLAFTGALLEFYADGGRALNPRMIKQRRTQLAYVLPNEIMQFEGAERQALFAQWKSVAGRTSESMFCFRGRSWVYRLYCMFRGA